MFPPWKERTMLSYQTAAPLSPIITKHTPVREVRIARNGALLSACEARYETLQEYMAQFSSPVSMLRGERLYSFYDPLCPEATIVVQCEAEEVCRRCDSPLDRCECPF